MTNSEDKQKNIVVPNLAIFCKPDRRCCSDGSTCPATYTKNSNGQTAFYKCGCM